MRSNHALTPPPKPHVVFALADDFGWANFGAHRAAGEQGAAEAQTPFLDGLLREGIELRRYYTYKICSPSRSALQSGRLPVHVNTANSAVSIFNESDPVSGYAGVPRNMTCVANKLAAAGYDTHFVGKWDAGHGDAASHRRRRDPSQSLLGRCRDGDATAHAARSRVQQHVRLLPARKRLLDQGRGRAHPQRAAARLRGDGRGRRLPQPFH